MRIGAYPAAQAAAPAIHSHFARHAGAAAAGAEAPPAPDVADIEETIEAAFWASLRREEGYVPRISLVLLAPERAALALRFERPLPLSAEALTTVAPAVERPGIHLGVARADGMLRVWGTTQVVPPYSFVLEVAGPGLLVVKHHRGEQAGKFVNVAVLEGNEVKIVDEDASSLPDCPALLASLVGFESPASWREAINVLVEVAVSMRAHGRGGLLLVVPPDSDLWRQSIVHPVDYALQPPFRELTDLVADGSGAGGREQEWQDRLGRTISMIAGLTEVDGATIMTDRYELLAFGAKIARRKGFAQVEQVMVTEPIDGSVATLAHPAQLGGTRHLSAAQFVQDQRDAIALVASQDGRFTIFAWSPCEEMVHAHRVETLLM